MDIYWGWRTPFIPLHIGKGELQYTLLFLKHWNGRHAIGISKDPLIKIIVSQ